MLARLQNEERNVENAGAAASASLELLVWQTSSNTWAAVESFVAFLDL